MTNNTPAVSADQQILVFTDLDGSLLDHDSYRWTAAEPALAQIATADIPLIAVSSKTLSELDTLSEHLPLHSFKVAENGAVIRLDDTADITPPGYAAIHRFLTELGTQPGFRFSCFTDMDKGEVAAVTGLDESAAERARQRVASETLLWQGSEQGLVAFKQAVEQAGLRWLQGGRFLHVLGNTDKGQAVQKITQWYRSRSNHPVLSIGLGDGDNDRAMLQAVDRPVIIRRKDGSHLQLPERPDALVTQQAGPAGWNQAIQQLLDESGVADDG